MEGPVFVNDAYPNYATITLKLLEWVGLISKLVDIINCKTLQLRHNRRDGVSNHQPHDRWIPRTNGQ